MEARVAKLESHVEHIQSDISEMKSDIKEIKRDIVSMEVKMEQGVNRMITYSITITLTALAMLAGFFALIKPS